MGLRKLSKRLLLNTKRIRCGDCRSKVWGLDLVEKREGTCEVIVKNSGELKTFTFPFSVFKTYMSAEVPRESLETYED